LILIVIVAFDIFWLAKGQTFFTTQVESILFSVGSVAAFALGLWVYFDIRLFWISKALTKARDIQTETERQSGKVLIQNDNIIWYDREDKVIGTIPLNKVKAIGEYTTSEGPLVDDWFYLFFISQNDIRQVSAYATNLNSVLESLSAKYKCDIIGHLSHSTTFESNVIWPTQLRGQKVYEALATDGPKTVWERIKFTFGQNVEMVLTNELRKHLE
jgi:hypothetical protein